MDMIVKIMILGEAGVGKTLLSHRYTNKLLTQNPLPTSGFDFLTTTLKVETGQQVKVQMLDVSGNEKFRSMILPHMGLTTGALIVYNVCDLSSFEKVQGWINTFKERCSKLSEPVLFMIGNQTDRETERQVTTDQGRALALENGILFAETSALMNAGVADAFNVLVADTYYAMKHTFSDRRPSFSFSQILGNTGALTVHMSNLFDKGQGDALLSDLEAGENGLDIDTDKGTDKGFFGGALDWLADEQDSEWEFDDEDPSEWLVPTDEEENPPALKPRTLYRSESGKLRRLASRKSIVRRNSSRKESSRLSIKEMGKEMGKEVVRRSATREPTRTSTLSSINEFNVAAQAD